jgi:hypothetical protein
MTAVHIMQIIKADNFLRVVWQWISIALDAVISIC